MCVGCEVWSSGVRVCGWNQWEMYVCLSDVNSVEQWCKSLWLESVGDVCVSVRCEQCGAVV